MQVQTLRYPQRPQLDPKKQVLAAGFFDGVHLGHQNVIKTAIRLAQTKGLVSAVLTFDRHPSLVYGKNKGIAYQYLSPLKRKLHLFQELGVDLVYIAEFNAQFSHLAPRAFVEEVLEQLNLDTLVAGFDWTFGPQKLANMTTLPQLAQDQFQVVQIPKLQFEQEKISSTKIRQCLLQKQPEQANLLLGYNYQNTGIVAHGRRVGRQLGFPTANLQIPAEQLLPAEGVYITRVQVQGTWHPAMTSIGRNVTFELGDNPVTVEANLLDFSQNIYDQQVRIEWLSYLRSEIKFANQTELIQQMNHDRAQTQKYFQK
ncbi:riboflavin biosynthesis protein RibF [Lactobacillus sp. DCY120]|uniref:Riboflavin biosynthesis protein n=1 Tax=Bombilactobacillus apium TaxID=2675299 RepID=A0A850R3U7_9LACO|nr:riboflavin biosynthesis protein RibF [Bombilactobacillus apium]NVY97040.1 riboflavin biosynthesis protein RibF [Bombilactobacillus apium]